MQLLMTEMFKAINNLIPKVMDGIFLQRIAPYTLRNVNLFMIPVIETEVCPLYDPYVGECLLERTLVLGHRLCEVGWPVPFPAAFISPVFPPGPHSLLGGHPTIGSRWVPNRGLRHSRQVLSPLCCSPMIPVMHTDKNGTETIRYRCLCTWLDLFHRESNMQILCNSSRTK